MRARDQAFLFIVTVLAASWGLELFMILNGGVGAFGPLWLVALMCVPGVISVALRLLLKLGFADAGLGARVSRSYGLAIGIPIFIAAGTCALSIALDIRALDLVTSNELITLMPALGSVLILGLIGAFGEELGWRGFLLPKLVGEVEHPYALTGSVWAAWHLPLIAFGGFYATDDPLRITLVYAIGILAMNLVFCELRMRSGSVWAVTIAHALHNFVLQFVVPVMILTAPGARAKLWDWVAGDTGLIVAALYLCAYLLLRLLAPTRAREQLHQY